MAKRGPTSELNHDNWDDDCEQEEAGVFRQAAEDVISKRKIKVAKRRSNASTDSGTSSPFSNFSGFKPQTPSSKPLFNLSTSNLTPTTNGSDEKPKHASLFNLSAKTNIPNNLENGSKSNSSEQEYVANLTSLNKKVTEWIKLHVDKNPLCILSPVFNDYERYLKEIKEKRSLADTKSNNNEGKSPLLMFKAAQDKVFNTDKELVANEKSTSESSPTSLQSSIFGGATTGQSILLKKPDPASLMVNPFTTKLSNTQDKTAESVSTGGVQAATQSKAFSFGGSSQPFTFANVTAPPQSSTDAGENDEETDEPPKPDFKPVQEEGALFSKRCKVFVKKDSSYADRGVGTLYVKKVSDAKYQLLVRADTVLGNILVNVLLSSTIPTKRMGKNNVMLVCLPTPDTPPPPTTVLLRVKTSEEADNLLQTLEQYKN